MSTRVHPRVCGGNSYSAGKAAHHPGTSPRVRGKRHPGARCGAEQRYIPACAGETASSAWWDWPAGVHPRVCGGNCRAKHEPQQKRGTSPRVRGKPMYGGRKECSPRYIPACAGETARPMVRISVTTVHPRVCGGNFIFCTVRVIQNGTSPRVRGKLWTHLPTVGRERYIPACAGETWLRPTSPRQAGVHPRVCGGNTRPRPSTKGGTGYIPACAGETRASHAARRRKTVHPRVCGGNLEVSHLLSKLLGYIPACAGETAFFCLQLLADRVHPRVCGETEACLLAKRLHEVHPRVCGGNGVMILGSRAVTGTSPRVRGKRSVPRSAPYTGRYIPACAGETCAKEPRPAWYRVHPRVCGGNVPSFQFRVSPRGTSPRVRGKQPERSWMASGLRYIPACAGETGVAYSANREYPVHPRVCGGNSSSIPSDCARTGTSPRVRGKPGPELPD